MTIRVGIIGPGDVAAVHVGALRRGAGEVVAVVGEDMRSARQFADEHTIGSSYDDLDTFLGSAPIDAVVVCTPSPLHAKHTLASLAAGKHVLSEIPFAMSKDEADAVVREAAASERNVMVAQTLRFCAPYSYLRGLVESGELVIEHLVSRRLLLRQRDEGWSGKPRAWTDSVVWHHAGHQLDLALWLLDAPNDSIPTSLHGGVGRTWPVNRQPMDLSISLVLPDRRLASLSLSYHSRIAAEDTVIITADESFTIEDGRLLRNGEVVVESEGDDAMKVQAIDNQDAEFLRSIEEGRPPSVGPEDLLGLVHGLAMLAD